MEARLKYGHNGLYLTVYINNSRKQNIFISDDNYKIFEFLGFDYNRYLKGFDTLEEIFDYVIDSKYFDSDMFDLENLNQKDRKRNRKRKTYQQFIRYVKVKSDKKYEFKHRDEYIVDIDKFFPESKLIEKLEELKVKDDINQRVSEKFNGKLVMELTGLQGKELGNFLNNFKQYIEDRRKIEFKKYVDSVKQEQLLSECVNFFKSQ